MLKLNILSEDYKKEIKLSSFYIVFKNITLFFVFLTAVVGIIFLLGDITLQTYVKHSGNNKLVTRNNYRNLDEQVKEAETKINNVMTIQENFINWSKLIEDIISKTNDNIIFKKITINRDKSELNLSGNAKTRVDLIELKESFKNSDSYLTIDFPIENILEKNDINFNILMIINPNDFR